MFFSLTRDAHPRFPCQWTMGDLVLNTDSGWRLSQNGSRIAIYKGYMHDGDLDQLLWQVEDNQWSGNFCIFDHDTSTGMTQVKTNVYRSFVAWHDARGLSNLFPAEHAVWTDSTVMIDQALDLHETKVDLVGPIATDTITRSALIDFVHDRLDRAVASWVSHNQLPIKVFCSGGVDSMLVFSYVKKHTDRWQMVFSNEVHWDEFWCRNQKHIRRSFWAYEQIHHWLKPCVLTSGAPGDEFMLRSPTTANLWLRAHGTSIPETLDSYGPSLHSDYFRQPKHLELFAQQVQIPADKQDLYRMLCNIVVNDCQHWHLGNTLTFTPLRDLEIFKAFLRLDLQSGLGQIMDSDISRELIARNDANLLDHLSTVKNTGESLANLESLMLKYRSSSGQ